MATQQHYRKHFISLESNLELFAELTHELGGSSAISFDDILSIDSPELLALVRQLVHALILTFPTTPLYEEDKRKEEEELIKLQTIQRFPPQGRNAR